MRHSGLDERGPDGAPKNYLVGTTNVADPLLPAGTYEIHVVNDTRYAVYPNFPARMLPCLPRFPRRPRHRR